MHKARLMLAAAATAILLLLGGASLASADPPSGGDTQCVPGHNGPSQSGFKPPTSCPGPNH